MREKLPQYLWATGISLCLGFGSVACTVTGLGLETELLPLAIGLLLTAAVCCAVLRLRHGGKLLLAAAAAVTLLALNSIEFLDQLYGILGHIGAYYRRAYGLELPEILQKADALSHQLPLLWIGALVTGTCCTLMLRRYPIALAVFLSLIPVASCFVVTDTVPQLLWLCVWLFGVILLLMSHPVRMRDGREGAQLTTLLSLPVALALVLLTVLVPQKGYDRPPIQIGALEDFFSRFQLPFVGQTSTGELVVNFAGHEPDRLDLTLIGNRKLRATPVMELEGDLTGIVYIRGRDRIGYTGTSWEAQPDRQELFAGIPSIWIRETRHLELRLLTHRKMRFLPYYPDTAKTLLGGMVPNEDRVTDYSYDCVVLREDWKARWRREAEIGSGFVQMGGAADSRYLQLPEQTRAAAQDLLGQIPMEDVTDLVALADRIGDFVQNSAKYDLDTDRMPSDQQDLAIWFLTQSETGYCVHFATAATVLLRAAGIPARYTEGYLTEMKAGEVTMVREEMAHAWVEYFVPGIGWVILDPTPGAGAAGDPTQAPTEPSATEPTETEPSQSETTRPTQPEPTEGPTAGTEAPPTEPAVDTVGPAPEPPQWLAPLLTGLLIALAVIAAAVGQWQLRRRYVLRKLYRGKTNAQALARYREVARLSKLCRRPVAKELTELAQKAAYSQHKLTAGELSALDRHLQECVTFLKTKNLFHRILHRLLWAAY